MMSKIATMKEVVEAIQDAATTDEETMAALTHLLSTRGLRLAATGRTARVARSFF